ARAGGRAWGGPLQLRHARPSGDLLEQNGKQLLLGLWRYREGQDDDVTGVGGRAALDFDLDSLGPDGHPLPLRFRDGRAQRAQQPPPCHLQEIVLGFPGRGPQIPPSVADELEDLHSLVDANPRRRVSRQEQPIEVPGHVDGTQGRRCAGRGVRPRGDRMHLGPGCELERAHRRGPDEDLVVLVDRGEVLSEAGETLRAAEEKEPALAQGVVQRRQDATLERLSEVDEYVPAGHEIELRERWVPGEIVPDEDAQVSDVLVDAIARLDLGEEAPAPLLADLAHDRIRVCTLAGRLDGALADVRAEDLDGMASGRVVQKLEQSNGE